MWKARLLAASCLGLTLVPAADSRLRADEAAERKGPKEARRPQVPLDRTRRRAAASRASPASPGDPLTYYAATASGGVWKSLDGGLSWKPVFDDQPVSLDRLDRGRAVRPERRLRRLRRGQHPRQRRRRATASTSRPTPARPGQHVWKQDGQIGTLVVHPTNPDVAFAAVLGHAFGPNPERGVYRTRDGGKTWQQVLSQGRRHRRLRRRARPEQPAHRLRRPLAGAAPSLGADERRPGQRPLRVARRRRHLEAAHEGDGLPEGIWGKVGVRSRPPTRGASTR